MENNRLSVWARITVVAFGGLLLLYILAKYLLVLLLPFLISWAIAFTVRPLACRLAKRIPIGTRTLRAALSVIVTLGSMTLIGLFLFRIVSEAMRLVGELAASHSIESAILSLLSPLTSLFREDGGELSSLVSDAVGRLLSRLLDGVGTVLSSIVFAVPDLFLFLIVTVIGSLYFAYDLERVNEGVLSRLPRRVGSWLVSFKDGALQSLLGYLRSYLILMGITFSIVTFGLVILRVDYALALALLIALLDALPVIGVGTVLVPWGIFALMMGNTYLGIGLLILFGVNTVVRQLIEPKIIGDSLGIHPILSLVLLYVLYRLFSLWGLLLLPVFTVILQVILKKEQPSAVIEGGIREGDGTYAEPSDEG